MLKLIPVPGGSIRRICSACIGVAAFATFLGVAPIIPATESARAETCGQLVINPGFEEGTAGWETQSATGSKIISPEAAFHGSYGASTGGTNGADDRFWQWISFPDNSSSMGLTFFYRIETADTSNPPADTFSVLLLDEQGNILADLVQLSNRNVHGQWYRRVRFFDPAEVQRLAGRRARLQFRATTDALAPTTFFVDDIDLQVCAGGPPALSDLRMSLSAGDSSRDHFPDRAEEVVISFTYANIGKDDEIRLRIRDVNGTSFLDHMFSNLVGSGSKQVIFTGRDAVDGLARSALDAGNAVARYSERALEATSRFSLAPYLEQAVLGTTSLENAATVLDTFQIGDTASAFLSEAQQHVRAALAAGQDALNPAHDLTETKALIATMRDEAQVAMVKVAEARSAVHVESLAFPDTIGCQFNLTNIYLNGAPVDSIEWTVGASGPPARIHPPQERRRAGALHVQPLIIYTQGVTPSEAPHSTEISGRALDENCRPVAGGTEVAFTLDDPSLGSFAPQMATTSAGYFTTSLWTTENLGDGAVTVRARVGEVEASGVVFLVGPPATLIVDAAAFTLNPGESTSVVVQVHDSRGQAVANGTEVNFSVSPPNAGRVVPASAATSSGFVSATFVAGDAPGYVTIRAIAGEVEAATVVQIEEPASTATPAPTATATPRPTRTLTPTPTATPTPRCDSSDPGQMCNGIVSVRVFEDARCDGQFNSGTDRALFGVPVSLIYPDGSSYLRTSDPNGYTSFGGVHLRGDERVALLAEFPEEMVTSGLTPCENSGNLKFLGRRDFGSFGTASVRFRTYRQIVVRRGVLQVAEASLCFTAKYYLDPTDDGPTVYLVTDEDLSEYLGREVEVTGSTWEIEFCRYIMPFSIELVP
ncbi:MAG: hypothetical protein ACE5HA_03015 [Anaerolineae bacterium]